MNSAKIHRIMAVLPVLMCIALMAPGCKTVHWSKADFNRPATKAKKKEQPPGVPEKMVAIWRDAVYESGTSPSARGFGGRFYFYDREQKAIRVDGELVIYAFDDSGSSNSTEADRKYVFEQESLQGHFSETALGASYSFWIPWDQVGGARRSIALIPVFKSADGQIIRGEQSVNVLTGKSPELVAGDPAETISNDSGSAAKSIATTWKKERSVNQVAYFDESNPNIIQTSESRRTTTINVPDETARRMQAQAASPIQALEPARSPAAPGALQPVRPASPTPSSTAADESKRKEQREKTGTFRPWPGMTEMGPQK